MTVIAAGRYRADDEHGPFGHEREAPYKPLEDNPPLPGLTCVRDACTAPAVSEVIAPLCGPHADDAIYALVRERGISGALSAATRAHDREHPRVFVPAPPPGRIDEPNGTVYYIQRRDLIKIGTTSNLRNRLRELRPDAILAIEPGSYTRERQRHLQFAEHRVRGEWFNPSPDLLEHIEDIKRAHAQEIVADLHDLTF